MKTEWRVLHRPRHDDQAADVYGQYATLDIAMAHTGHPLAEEWRAANVSAEADGEDAPEASVLLLVDGIGAPGRRQEWMIVADEVAETDAERIELAVRMALNYGCADGDHHKMWAIDQMLRILTGDRYEQVVAVYETGEDGPNTYTWNTGIAP